MVGADSEECHGLGGGAVDYGICERCKKLRLTGTRK